mmetsp:Transcript_82468/g.232046  ORF Transcript_82468/g.232046 Transcript_82468/m.232046 type:complete len:290 (+) Transcript_82468:297-1166(+)
MVSGLRMWCMEPRSSMRPQALKRVISGARSVTVRKYMCTHVCTNLCARSSSDKCSSPKLVTLPTLLRDVKLRRASLESSRASKGSQTLLTSGADTSTVPSRMSFRRTCTVMPNAMVLAWSFPMGRPARLQAANIEMASSAIRTKFPITKSASPCRGLTPCITSRAKAPGKKQTKWSIFGIVLVSPTSFKNNQLPLTSVQSSNHPPRAPPAPRRKSPNRRPRLDRCSTAFDKRRRRCARPKTGGRGPASSACGSTSTKSPGNAFRKADQRRRTVLLGPAELKTASFNKYS